MALILTWNLLVRCGLSTGISVDVPTRQRGSGRSTIFRHFLSSETHSLRASRALPIKGIGTGHRSPLYAETYPCFLRTYAALPTAGPSNYEDALESPLIELGLIKSDGTRDGFRFVRGPKPSLDPSVFCYAVTDYWERSSSAAITLSFEALIHEPGSPGRVFMLDENSLVELLDKLEPLTDGIYRWSETAGLKQLIRTKVMTEEGSLAILAARHRPAQTKDAA